MKNVEISYEEIIKRINSITIEVDDDFDEEEMFSELDSKTCRFDHPDDMMYAASTYGKIVDTMKGAENCEYELV